MKSNLELQISEIFVEIQKWQDNHEKSRNFFKVKSVRKL